jgi:hypothetical protein
MRNSHNSQQWAIGKSYCIRLVQYLPIKCVEVDPRSQTRLKERTNHFYCLVNPIVSNCLVVVLQGFDDVDNLLGNLQS